MKLKKTKIILMLAMAFLMVSSMATAGSGQAPMVIQEQGSFLSGGTVLKTPGTFDPKNATDPAGQTLHGDHAQLRRHT